MFEPILALATPPLKSALAIIRLSGDGCFNIINKCFSRDISDIEKRTIVIGNITSDGTVIDNVVLLLYKGPHSYTGEDMVEIICHGSMLIVEQIETLLIQNGARYATNGEYTSRAFLHQKMDLVQAEAVNDIINATSEEAKNLSMLSLDGKTSELIYPIKEDLAALLSLIEVNIDYPEYEDIEVANKESVVATCNKLIKTIDKLIKNGEKGKVVKDGVNAAIIGRPNVGKSTLLNTLLGENKAIVSNIAGTTRDVVEGDVNIGGLTLHLLDTAGYRKATNEIEEMGIEKTKEMIKKADLVLVVVDATQGITKQDQDLIKLTKGKPRIVVHNKKDLLSENELDNEELLYISSLTGDISDLTKAILKKFKVDESVYKTPSLNNARQLGLLLNIKENLEAAKKDATSNVPLDLVSTHLYAAYQSVLDILGEDNKVDISKEIFSRFCVGK
ncbi:MAG: tRNA uridine-5-carboxymethylaminomethyl(34) synthesis GTPase MnmE [Coprobacillus sp.]|nr:tRNA uridine-5-carboxymethylaminomethyl(34) synthesis GTPase MnmE [Coprobacillus sp.]